MSAAEYAVIGGLLNSTEQWDLAAQVLDENDFASHQCRKLWRTISGMVQAGDQVDVITVADKGHDLADLGELVVRGNSLGVARHAQIVRAESVRRQATALLSNTTDRLRKPDEDVTGVLADTAASLEALQTTPTGYYDATRWVSAALMAQSEAMQAREAHGMPGVPTGLHALDRVTGGWRRKKLYTIAARPSIGKTSLAMHSALYAGLKGRPTGVIEIEMDADELGNRALSSMTGIPYWDLSMGKPDALARVREHDAPHRLAEATLYVEDELSSLNAIIARASEWVRKHQIEVLWVDHLGLVRTASKENRNLELGVISSALKRLAKRLDIAVVVLCQLNRSVEVQKRRPVLADLRESGHIEEDVDAAIFLHCENADRPVRKVEVGALKNRSGIRGWLDQDLEFDATLQRWTCK